MNKLRLLSILVALLWTSSAARAQDEESFKVENLSPESQLAYDNEHHIFEWTRGVRIQYGDATLTADRVTLQELTGQVTAEGHVLLRRDKQLWSGDRIEYNFKTRQIQAAQFKIGAAPFYAAGVGLSLDQSNQVYTATDGYLTTDDSAEPALRIRAKQLKIVPGQYIEAHDAVLYHGTVPLMYFPYYKRNLYRHPNNWVLTPGYRSLYGPYLLTTYNWQVNDRFSAYVDLDYRQKRGFAGGPGVTYSLDRWGSGDLATYFTHDDKPGNDPAGKPIMDENRRWVYWTHQATIRTNLTAKIALREQSDPYVVRDFFETEYRKNIQPSSYLELNQLGSNFSLNVLAQPQINDFFETAERLPDVKLTGVRQQLGVSPFYYESESSVGYFRYRFSDGVTPGYEAFRADSFHQLVWPLNYFGWLNVTPRVGGRFTHYSEASGAGARTREEDRWVFNTGAEISTKASRTWTGVHNRFWEVDGLRHIIEPSINYVFVPSPNKLPPQLPQFDQQLDSFRLLPIDYPDYNAIDSIDSQNVMRLGLRNKLQTKRQGVVENLAHWALYSDWRLSPRPDQKTFADLYSDLDFKPRNWLTLTSETRYDIGNGRWNEANHYATFQPNYVWSYAIGHRYLRNQPIYGPLYGNNLITSRLTYRLNENYAFRMSHHFEARDGVMEEQYYTLYRDLRSWTTAITFRIRDNRSGPKDFTVAITFSLKAFPRFGLGTDRETPSLLLGG